MIEGRPRESLVLYDNPIEVRFISISMGFYLRTLTTVCGHLRLIWFGARPYFCVWFLIHLHNCRSKATSTLMIPSRSPSDVRRSFQSFNCKQRSCYCSLWRLCVDLALLTLCFYQLPREREPCPQWRTSRNRKTFLTPSSHQENGSNRVSLSYEAQSRFKLVEFSLWS